MALKNKYAKAEEIPAELKSFYVERDGTWLLDSERNEELRQTNITVMKELGEYKRRFDGIDPEAVRQLAEEKRQLEEAAQIKAGEFDKVSEARTRAALAVQAKEFAPVLAERDSYKTQLERMTIDEVVLSEALKRGLRVTAKADLMYRARAAFKLVAGQPRIFEADGTTLRTGKDGVTPQNPAEWVDALATDAPHLFEANAGGGAVGSGSRGAAVGGVNPFCKATANLTEQMRLLKQDPGLAARLKALAN